MKITNTFFPQTQLASLICKKHKITIKEKSIAFSCKNKVAFTLLTSMVQYFLLKRQVSTKKTKRPHLIGFSALSKEAGKGINKFQIFSQEANLDIIRNYVNISKTHQWLLLGI